MPRRDYFVILIIIPPPPETEMHELRLRRVVLALSMKPTTIPYVNNFTTRFRLSLGGENIICRLFNQKMHTQLFP